MRILTAESMREVDRTAIEEIGIPSLVLMENAALGLVEAVTELFEEADAVAIFCGPGNNGGDGLALARHLDARGHGVEVFLCTAGKDLSGDAATQHSICRRQGISITEVADEADALEAVATASDADLVVDALFGTGLGRPLEGMFAALVQGINDLPLPVLAVDLPSGLNGSRPELFGPHVLADVTVTFAAPKLAQILPPTADAVGELLVTDLGIPPRLIDEAPAEEGTVHLLTGEELAVLVPDRPAHSHKGSYGHVLVVAGSTGKGGAAVLTARGAVRSGAGLVTAAVPEPLVAMVDGGSLESMTVPLAAAPSGQINAAAVDAVLAAARGKDAVALGPGLGQDDATAETIRELVLRCPRPMVLDADGLNAFAGRLGALADRPAPTVLTPHPGELGRLLGTSAAEVQGDRLGAARRAARESGCVVVLKGHQTLVAVPVDGGPPAVHVCPTGNPGMATGGSGDVLTGILAGLLGQLLGGGRNAETAAADAACLGTYLHGLAGDLAAEAMGQAPLAAGDLLDHLPAAFTALEDG